MKPTSLVLRCVCLLGIAAALPAAASLSVYMTPEQLAERSSVIVEGTVVRHASGFDPVSGVLATYITLEVGTVHRGNVESAEIMIREPGGRFGHLVHEVDAVPNYEIGEQVFAFLEPGPDGTLRTTGMFFGKYSVESDAAVQTEVAVRDLEGQGRILHRPHVSLERVRRSDLAAVAATVQRRRERRERRETLRVRPPEFDRLQWAEVRETAAAGDPVPERRELVNTSASFVTLSATHPARWAEVDSGATLTYDLDRSNNPLGDGVAAMQQIQRAMDAWTDVPESRVSLALGNDNANYVASHPLSPAVSFNGQNIILFGDPYDDITAPSGCAGVLAIGGYWRGVSVTSSVNGQSFYPAMQGYVIFNDGFECFLGDPDNLAEVAAHELGHTLGFGHSNAWDSIMRASAYGFGRGPRLGSDDQDAAHCHYPHTLAVAAPVGGTTWNVGDTEGISWSSTPEAGADPGTVDLELSIDGGAWQPFAAGETNDGYYSWVVSGSATSNAMVRVVRHNRGGTQPAGYPSACSQAQSSSFALNEPIPLAGRVPDGISGPAFVVDKAAGSQLRFSWSTSCSGDTDDYAVYAGDLAQLRSGVFSPAPLECSAGPDLVEYLTPASGNQFFLVVTRAGNVQGNYGRSSGGAKRANPALVCGSYVEASSVCY